MEKKCERKRVVANESVKGEEKEASEWMLEKKLFGEFDECALVKKGQVGVSDIGGISGIAFDNNVFYISL